MSGGTTSSADGRADGGADAPPRSDAAATAATAATTATTATPATATSGASGAAASGAAPSTASDAAPAAPHGAMELDSEPQPSTAVATASVAADPPLVAPAPATTTTPSAAAGMPTATHDTPPPEQPSDAIDPPDERRRVPAGASQTSVSSDATESRPSSANREAAPTPTAKQEGEGGDGDGAAASHSHSDAESTNSSIVTVTYTRKKRRPVVTEAEDIAILRAIARLQPHRAPRGSTAKRIWLQVVDAVVAEIGPGCDVSRDLCQRRYEILISRFLTNRVVHKNWPPNPELRELLEAAVEQRKAAEDESRRHEAATASHPALSLSALRAALAASAANGGKVSLEPKTEAVTGNHGGVKRESQIANLTQADGAMENRDDVPSTAQVDATMDDLFGDIPASRSPTKRRSYVESTVVAVLDRLADMEKTWLENAREERALKRQKLEIEIEQRKAVGSKRKRADDASKDVDMEADESSTTGTNVPSEPAPVSTCDGATATQAETRGDRDELENGHANAQTSTPSQASDLSANATDVTEAATTTEERDTSPVISHTDAEETDGTGEDTRTAVSQEAVEALKSEVSMLSSSVTISQQAHKQLTDQVAMLSTVLNDVQVEKDVLKQDVATLQALLRDAASLAGTLRVLRESHQQHEQRFETYTMQQDARIDALKREVKERHQLIRDQLAPLSHASGAKQLSELRASIKQEREQLQAEHAKQLAELDQKMKALEHPVGELRVTVDKQQSRLGEQEAKVKSVQANHIKVDKELRQIKTEIESDRKERLSEYGTLLRTVEQVAAGKVRLI